MTQSRIHGLDSARSAMLLLGVVFHAAVFSRWSGGTDRFEFEWLQAIIHSFRMPAFFAVAGYLMAITLPRRQNYLRGRMRQLLVPAVCTWLFILPIGWLARDGSLLWQPDDISILWFLVALAGATAIVVGTETAGLNEWLGRVIAKVPLAAIMFGFFLVVYVTATIAGTLQWEWNLRETIGSALVRIIDCTPFLMLGLFICRIDKLRDLLRHRAVRWIGPVALAIYAAHFIANRDFYVGDRSLFDRTVSRAILTAVSVGMTMSVLAWSGRLLTEHVLSARLSAAAFTIYLFHMPILDVLYAVSRGWNPWIQFIVFIPTATALCYGAHHLLIRHPLTAFMFNGRPFAPRSGRRETVR